MTREKKPTLEQIVRDMRAAVDAYWQARCPKLRPGGVILARRDKGAPS